MDRTDLQRICECRLKEARILYEHGRFDGAYYLLGYALECSLKSCIAKQIKEHVVPDKDLINKFYTHKLNDLLGFAGLRPKFEEACMADNDLKLNWAVVGNWSEACRYRHNFEWKETKDFFDAVHNERSGVLKWLMNWW